MTQMLVRVTVLFRSVRVALPEAGSLSADRRPECSVAERHTSSERLEPRS